MNQKDYPEAEAPNSYRLTYTNPLTKTHGLAHSRVPSQIFASMEKLEGDYSWRLEKGRECFWTLIDSFTHPDHMDLDIPHITN
jgi:hypothetical protein